MLKKAGENMYFVIAKSNDSKLYRVFNGKSYIDTNKIKQIQNICDYKESRLGTFDINTKQIIKNAYTVLGKCSSNDNSVSTFIICDSTGSIKRVTKEIIIKTGENSFTNIIICKNETIRLIRGTLPLIKDKHKETSKNTVIKIGSLIQSTSGSVGVGKKFFGKRVSDNKFGCVKFEIFPNSLDINNEVLAYKLGKLLKFDVAEASFETYNSKRCIISIYNYNKQLEKITSLKSEIGTENFHNKFNKKWFIQNKSEKAWNKFIQMIMLDLIMHQTDRHISNIAFKDKDLYSLYDNGRALFFDCVDTVPDNIDLNNRGSIVESFVTNEHGYGWVFLEDVLGYNRYKNLIRHDLEYTDFEKIVTESYENKNTFRNEWIAEYMFKVYLIIIRQEKRFRK
jgi:hypothetical protein